MAETIRQRARRVFMEVADLPPEERAAALLAASAGDEQLRAEVQALLDAEARAGGFMSAPTSGPEGLSPADAAMTAFAPTAPASVGERPGMRIGPYKLLQLIGEGGFGSVFMAEQERPVIRKVALKIIKLGMDTRAVIARFEAERQALAMMDHPNIAKVLDAGATELGRPYFVMELCRGDPIHEYCDKNNLSITERLELFAQVCTAVQHAHTKGIIHRDIKPSNILVSTQDGRPHAKVIDFGIAKATASKLTEKTLFTEHKALIGTPEYMSPEQAEGSLDIDTRTDVYSLGVLLYELLTGTTPFSSKELRSAAYGEIQRIIREVEPPKPSTRLSANTDTLASVAAKRHTEPKRLSVLIRGDLDWIVMKALEKDRQRRYETANGLMMDIRRYIEGEAVDAAPPSAAYRFNKFIRRNKGTVAVGLLVSAVVALGLIGTSVGLFRADRAKRLALAERAAADAARAAAEDNEARAVTETQRAERELARANEIRALITGMLTGVDPAKARTQDTTLLRGILENAAARLSRGEITDELVAAELHSVIGEVYQSLGLFAQAEAHLPAALEIRRRVLGSEHLLTVRTIDRLAVLYATQGRFAETEPLLLEALAIQRRVFGDDHHNTPNALSALATHYTLQGRYAEAEPLYLEALATQRRLGSGDHQRMLAFMNNLGGLYWHQERYAAAEPLIAEALEIQRRELGADHPDTLMYMANLALVYQQLGRHTQAETMFLEALDLRRRVFGAEHPETLGAITNLGRLYNEMGRYEDAASRLEVSLPVHRRIFGVQHLWTQLSIEGLAEAYTRLGRLDEALPLWREAIEFQTAATDAPGASPHTLNTAAKTLLKSEIGQIYDPARALTYARRACTTAEAAGGATLWRLLDTLALAQHRTGDAAAAVETQKRAISLMPDPNADPNMAKRLAEYEAALTESTGE